MRTVKRNHEGLTANVAPTGFLIHLGGFCSGITFSSSWGIWEGTGPCKNESVLNDSATCCHNHTDTALNNHNQQHQLHQQVFARRMNKQMHFLAGSIWLVCCGWKLDLLFIGFVQDFLSLKHLEHVL